MSELELRLKANVVGVLRHIEEYCAACGRDPAEVRLVGVTKYVDTKTARALASVIAQVYADERISGPIMLGENRPQVLSQRLQEWEAGPQVEWHLIGHLQTNKIKLVARAARLIHSLDRFDVLDRLQEFAGQHQLTVRGLLEFRTSRDEAKHGFDLSDAPKLVERWGDWPNLQLSGVMGMSGLDSTPEQARKEFEALSEVFQWLGQQLSESQRVFWRERSMGMSADLPQAVAAGASLVRIGSALFKGVMD